MNKQTNNSSLAWKVVRVSRENTQQPPKKLPMKVKRLGCPSDPVCCGNPNTQVAEQPDRKTPNLCFPHPETQRPSSSVTPLSCYGGGTQPSYCLRTTCSVWLCHHNFYLARPPIPALQKGGLQKCFCNLLPFHILIPPKGTIDKE